MLNIINEIDIIKLPIYNCSKTLIQREKIKRIHFIIFFAVVDIKDVKSLNNKRYQSSVRFLILKTK